MKITQLRLRNFKSFRNVQIEFRPLTLLTGINSSGKSTILNAIGAILQTQSPQTFPFQLVPNGDNCSLGSFRDIAYGNNTRTNFSIGVSLLRKGISTTIDAEYRYSSSGNQILPNKTTFNFATDGFQLNWKGQSEGYKAILNSTSHDEVLRDESMMNLKNSVMALIKPLGQSNKKITREIHQIEHRIFGEGKNRWFKLKGRTPTELLDEIRLQPAGNYIVTQLLGLLRDFDSSCNYIGPIRVRPERFYQSSHSGQTVDAMGKNAVILLNEWKKYSQKKFEDVLSLIKLLELASTIQTKPSLDEILVLNVQPFQHREKVNLADVGFGLSQMLPIVVADVALPTDGTLLVNQPEVHLHPSSQAQLGNYFSSRLKTRNYVIETHSEYLINRLRLLIAKGAVDPKDVLIVFIEPPLANRKHPKLQLIEIAKDGSLENAPKSFFQTYFLDTFNLAMSGFPEDA